ncbi:MAG TPA: hypothetical protein VK698_13485 [Kofleriaceae bacterium]|nr:hypothetical protein [Kofleriaceae bacterium]
MKRFVGSMISAALSLALASALGCGGGDKGGSTTPATNEPPAAEEPAPTAEQPAETPAEPATPAEGTPTPEQPAPAAANLSDQLTRAGKVWGDSCSTCHGDKGEGKGKKNPAVIGGKTLGKFKTGGELLDYVKVKMPKDDPGSLSGSDYLAVTAWLIAQNGRLGETNEALTPEIAANLKLH